MKAPRIINALRYLMFAGLLVIAAASLVGVARTETPPRGPERQLDQVHSLAGVKCASCHVAAARSAPVRMETCQTCHASAALASKTAEFKPTNPHNNPHYGTETDCNLCHHQHQASVNDCSGCHTRFDFKVP